jgi:hypothetical protein
MKRLISAKTLAAAAVAIGAIGVASAAHARSDVFFSIGVQAPYGYVQPAPVYVQPQPNFVPYPPAYYGNGYYNNGYYDNGATIVYERDHRRHYRNGHRSGPWGDADRDGVVNRYDRAPHNPYRR